MTERLIVHAWKACVPKGTGGSNPPPSVSIVYAAIYDGCITLWHNKAPLVRLSSSLFADILQSIFLLLGWLQLNEKGEQAQGKTCNSCITFAERKHEQETEADGKSREKKAIYFRPAAA